MAFLAVDMFYDDFMRRFALGRNCIKVMNGGYLCWLGTWIILHAYMLTLFLVHYLWNIRY